MEPIADALADAATLPSGTELLVGPGWLLCTKNGACILHDEDDPRVSMTIGTAFLVNGQREMLVANPSLLNAPAAVRLVRASSGRTSYQALEVVDARTREPIGLE
ncbi:hypothetical protein [Lichenicoccus roseus]|uniref:Uncharacterized protein n=1 Tax=Lichenicoccus roseus TaxID=2683649 RepID=A0A5R9JB83_9PROT|nr:hypothetical protein [Lichenicoccus roseus]TLU73797.1 hypothetical protein FE263_00740 [Lichenicoccus roseus]